MNIKRTILLSAVILNTFMSTNLQAEDFKIDDYMLNPVSRYVTEEKWNEIVNEGIAKQELKEKQERMFTTAKVITVDTRDRSTCANLQKRLMNSTQMSRAEIDSICALDPANPYSSIVVENREYQSEGIKFSDLSKEQQNIVGQTRNFALLGAGVIGVLWMLPESVTKWDKDEIGSLGSKYMSNIKEGPVWDEDDWAINYIGHPYSGAAYHVIARNAGLSPLESFGYGIFMSTIVWEYGLEAMAEVPSIQDLILTPVLGSLFGEAFIQMTENIKKNKGKFLGSEKLGAIAMALMDPAGATLNGINGLFENDFIKESRMYIYQRPFFDDLNSFGGIGANENVIGIGLELKF